MKKSVHTRVEERKTCGRKHLPEENRKRYVEESPNQNRTEKIFGRKHFL